MKKLLLSTLFVFLLFVPFVSCDSPASLSEEETSKIDRTFWWRSTEDDSGLRKRFEELNDKYFDGNLRVKYIRYGDGLIYEDLSAITCYWNRTSNSVNAGESVITVDRKFIEENPNELDGDAVLIELERIYGKRIYNKEDVPGKIKYLTKERKWNQPCY